MKKVLIVGGGISGLVTAFELSENKELDITIIESSNKCGGKMIGYFNTTTNRFEEHSIRVIINSYHAFLDLLNRIGLVESLEDVSSYIFYERKSKKRITINRKEPLTLSAFKSIIKTFDLSVKDVLKFISLIVKYASLSKKQRQQKYSDLEFNDVLDRVGIGKVTKDFFANWICLLISAKLHTKATTILDLLMLMFLPMKKSTVTEGELFSKLFCFNRPTSEIVYRIIEKLKERGVRFELNTTLQSINNDNGSVCVKTNNKIINEDCFDSCVLALPQKVLWKLGFLSNMSKPFKEEWAFGSQFPMEIVPHFLKNYMERTCNLCFDSPWRIAFQIQTNELFWKDVNFPKEYSYNLSATCSNPLIRGDLYNKRFDECTPEESLHEILYQIGIEDVSEREKLVKNAVVDSIYLKYTDDWEKYENYDNVEFGVLQENGNRWVNFSQSYIRSVGDKDIESITKYPSVFLAGEVVKVPGYWNIATMEQATMSGKQAAQNVFDYLKIHQKVYIEYSTLEKRGKVKLLHMILSIIVPVLNLFSRRRLV